ncbi:hypothetical protein EJ06DRAFT_415075 [Trichodelitschia bisporula]|uniref:ACT domain-containing protein n=1 Tax=Trichodelitschia bisporula TaxID=703511 RepID=A0A6G1HYP1_9PEZI|nr:hypothetical protein EJ06DRAFT_415075 [Trichodelitschia bisporula]
MITSSSKAFWLWKKDVQVFSLTWQTMADDGVLVAQKQMLQLPCCSNEPVAQAVRIQMAENGLIVDSRVGAEAKWRKDIHIKVSIELLSLGLDFLEELNERGLSLTTTRRLEDGAQFGVFVLTVSQPDSNQLLSIFESMQCIESIGKLRE